MCQTRPQLSKLAQNCANPTAIYFFPPSIVSAKAFFLAIVGAEYLLQLLPRGTHDYAKFIRPSELAAWTRQNKLMTHDISGIHYNPLTGKHGLTSDPAVNYLMHCQKPNT